MIHRYERKGLDGRRRHEGLVTEIVGKENLGGSDPLPSPEDPTHTCRRGFECGESRDSSAGMGPRSLLERDGCDRRTRPTSRFLDRPISLPLKTKTRPSPRIFRSRMSLSTRFERNVRSLSKGNSFPFQTRIQPGIRSLGTHGLGNSGPNRRFRCDEVRHESFASEHDDARATHPKETNDKRVRKTRKEKANETAVDMGPVVLVASAILAVVGLVGFVVNWIVVGWLYWAVPFLPYIWKPWYMLGPKIGFEVCYTINFIRRFLTLPLRPHLPEFYIVGYPKAGTTSLAAHLKRHPALSSLCGLPFHETLTKESHYFNGVYGPNHAASATWYRSFFPTVFTRWWREKVVGVKKWMCFDACPVPSVLPHCASRMAAITPNAKLIFMLRDPVDGVFSAEMMLRNLNLPLDWTLQDPYLGDDKDTRFKESKEDTEMWEKLRKLKPEEPLPPEMPETLYFKLASYIRGGRFADNVQPFFEHFPTENMMFIDFREFKADTEGVLKEVYKFLGIEDNPYVKLKPGMVTDYKGRKMHPSCKRKLQELFYESNHRFYRLLGRDFKWGEPDLESDGFLSARGSQIPLSVAAQ